MLKIDHNYKNYIPTATNHNAVIDSPSIDICITDDRNQNPPSAAKCLLEWHFRFRRRNLCDIQVILCQPPFGTDRFLSSSHIPFEQHPKCEVYNYSKVKGRALDGKKTKIDIYYE